MAVPSQISTFAPHTLAGLVGVDVRGLAHSPRLPIALAAQLLDQGIELVLYDTYGAGADLHEAQPAGFDEVFIKRRLADAEALQHLAFSQDSLADHTGLIPFAPRFRSYSG